MRRNLPVNVVLMVAAAMAALVLTVVRRSPEGLVTIGLDAREVRAAPGATPPSTHDLSALEVFNFTLLRIKERYVDPSRIDPHKMLYQALDSVQFNIPEVLVEPDPAADQLTVMVNDKRETFATGEVKSLWRLASTLRRVFRFIQTNMNSGADLARVEYAAVNGMLGTLDPHSNLMDPEAAREMDVSTSGKFGGLGIVIRMVDRKLTVIRPMKDTPASRAGILAGDHIVQINAEPTENLTSDEAVDRMRGTPRTPVTLLVARKGTPQPLRFDLVRAEISVASVHAKLLDKHVGILRVTQFQSTTAREAEAAMRQLTAQGAKAWVLDLRGNPGGLLEQAVRLVDLFVDRGAVVTTVSNRGREVHEATRGAGDTQSSVAVLVNRGSASASEIVAGALKNFERGVLIGTKTYGKGSVQELYDNDADGSKLKLTAAQYLTPGDRSIQNVGIVPDIALTRMYVPEQNQDVRDQVRLLPPSRQYGEQELEAHLDSEYVPAEADVPTFELAYLVARKPAKPTPAPAPTAGEGDDDEEAEPDPDLEDVDEIVEDFETDLARDLVASAADAQRADLLRAARPLVTRVAAAQQQALAQALGKIAVDWAPPPAPSPGATLDVALTVGGAAQLNATGGDTLELTATAVNRGTQPAHQVLVRLASDDDVFRDRELPIGRLQPGETRTFTTRVKLPVDAAARLTHLDAEVREAGGATARVSPARITIAAQAAPEFAFAYHLLDDGNGDGLVQRAGAYRLRLAVKNLGPGPSAKTTVDLRNASGDGVTISKSRFELGLLAAGASQVVEFPFSLSAALGGEELVLEVSMYDEELRVATSEKLHFPIRPAIPSAQAAAGVEVKAKTVVIRSGADADSPQVASAGRGARLAALGTFGPWTKVDLGGGQVGFVPTRDAKGVAEAPASPSGVAAYWNSTPPVIQFANRPLVTAAATYPLAGTVSDETKVEDLYVIVSNPGAKIDGRKVLYLSNRGAADPRSLAFQKDIPLWPGSNHVIVVAREHAEVRAVEQFFVYREAGPSQAAPP